MNGLRGVAARLKVEFFQEIKAFVDRRAERCPPGDPRWRVTAATLQTLKLTYPELPLDHLEMIAALYRDSAAGVQSWMSAPQAALGQRPPTYLLRNPDEIPRLKRLIERLFQKD
ncbi:MAG: hypothetical protein GX444_11195 [Myxococcales bacterium]|nr:hypothetical protein [Myxococcales bacterium]